MSSAIPSQGGQRHDRRQLVNQWTRHTKRLPKRSGTKGGRKSRVATKDKLTPCPQTDSTEKLRLECKYVECLECGQTTEWRIRLRQCGHVMCVRCALEWLQHCIVTLLKARISCRKQGCVRRIHPNDIDALLELANTQLDDYTLPETRLYLQQRYRTTVVEYALGGRSTSVHCPECATPYFKEPGCNYVQCAFQSCNTWFCFHCAEPVESVAHFNKESRCKLEPTDLYRASYLLRMFFETNVIGIVALSPVVIYIFLVLFPLAMFLVSTYKGVSCLALNSKLPATTKMRCVYAIPAVLLGLIVGVLSLPVGIVFVLLYFIFLIIRFMPVVILMTTMLRFTHKIAPLFGVDSISNLLTDAQEARLLLEVEEYHMEQEKSELVDPELMTKSQALEERVRREDRRLHQARLLGLDKFERGAINVSQAVVKTTENVNAIKEDRLTDVQIVGLSNVKISGGDLIQKFFNKPT